MESSVAKLEIIAFNIASCEIAQAAGAARIELCDNPADGGTTPSYGFIKAARAALACSTRRRMTSEVSLPVMASVTRAKRFLDI